MQLKYVKIANFAFSHTGLFITCFIRETKYLKNNK